MRAELCHTSAGDLRSHRYSSRNLPPASARTLASLRALRFDLNKQVLSRLKSGDDNEFLDRLSQTCSNAFRGEEVSPEALTGESRATVDRLFELIYSYSLELETRSGGALRVTCTEPSFVTENMSNNRLEAPSTVCAYRARFSTKSYSLVIKSDTDAVKLYLMPARSAIGLSRLECTLSPIAQVAASITWYPIDNSRLGTTQPGLDLKELARRSFNLLVMHTLHESGACGRSCCHLCSEGIAPEDSCEVISPDISMRVIEPPVEPGEQEHCAQGTRLATSFEPVEVRPALRINNEEAVTSFLSRLCRIAGTATDDCDPKNIHLTGVQVRREIAPNDSDGTALIVDASNSSVASRLSLAIHMFGAVVETWLKSSIERILRYLRTQEYESAEDAQLQAENLLLLRISVRKLETIARCLQASFPVTACGSRDIPDFDCGASELLDVIESSLATLDVGVRLAVLDEAIVAWNDLRAKLFRI